MKPTHESIKKVLHVDIWFSVSGPHTFRWILFFDDFKNSLKYLRYYTPIWVLVASQDHLSRADRAIDICLTYNVSLYKLLLYATLRCVRSIGADIGSDWVVLSFFFRWPDRQTNSVSMPLSVAIGYFRHRNRFHIWFPWFPGCWRSWIWSGLSTWQKNGYWLKI